MCVCALYLHVIWSRYECVCVLYLRITWTGKRWPLAALLAGQVGAVEAVCPLASLAGEELSVWQEHIQPVACWCCLWSFSSVPRGHKGGGQWWNEWTRGVTLFCAGGESCGLSCVHVLDWGIPSLKDASFTDWACGPVSCEAAGRGLCLVSHAFFTSWAFIIKHPLSSPDPHLSPLPDPGLFAHSCWKQLLWEKIESVLFKFFIIHR